MALVTKMIRCAKCGSSEVVYDGKAVYHCAACGMDCDHAMPAADLAEAVLLFDILDADHQFIFTHHTRPLIRYRQRSFRPC